MSYGIKINNQQAVALEPNSPYNRDKVDKKPSGIVEKIGNYAKNSLVGRGAYKIYDTILPRNPVTKSREFHFVPEFVEIFMGNMFYHTFINQNGGIDYRNKHTNLVEHVTKELTRNSERSHLPYKITIVNSGKINAFCLPGGNMAITRGMLDAFEKDNTSLGVSGAENLTMRDKISAVLSHEITHAAARHGGRTIEIRILFVALVILLKNIITLQIIRNNPNENERTNTLIINAVDAVFDTIQVVFLVLLSPCISRSHEFEADKYGIVLMNRAKHKLEASVWLQTMFTKMNPKPYYAWLSFLEGLTRSHPYSEKRIEENKKTIQLVRSGKLV